MQYLKYNVIIGCFLSYFCIHSVHKAVVIVPVADILGSPIKHFGLGSNISDSYESMGICGAPNQSSVGSPRIHQLLFNEMVEILTDEQALEEAEEVCIRFDGVFFITCHDSTKNHLYWTQKKNLLTLKKMKLRKLNLDNIPEQLNFKMPTTTINNPIIVLRRPFFDPVTKQTFSAGTRFVYDPTQNNNSSFKVSIFDRLTTSFKTSYIPYSHAHILSFQSKEESIACFVNLLQQWSREYPDKIPYVWGGCSFVATDNPFDYQLITKTTKRNKKYPLYERGHYNQTPLAGFDCAGLILRAAQICGIPYFYKNTYTLAHFLDPLGQQDTLKEGDLIWIPGHVMVISDIPNNLLIEARGYSHDYGIVHEIELSKVFKDIQTYQQLVNAYHNHRSLIRLNRGGNEIESIKKFKLLKLDSTWK